MPILEATELYRFYHSGDAEVVALRGVSLAPRAGELVALLGPSGSGKSTLLHLIAGLDEPDGGHVDIAGLRLSRRPERVRAEIRARHIGMFMQSGNLIDHLTVGENIRLQRRIAGKGEGEATVAMNVVNRLGLAHRTGMPCRHSSPAAKRRGPVSPWRSRRSRRSCSATSRRPKSMPKPSVRSSPTCSQRTRCRCRHPGRDPQSGAGRGGRPRSAPPRRKTGR